MANEIQFQYTTGKTIYAIVRNASAEVWSVTAEGFVTFADADISDYAMTVTEQGNSGYYLADFPTGITSGGRFKVVAFEEAGSGPAESDISVAEGQVEWDGSAVVSDSGANLVTL